MVEVIIKDICCLFLFNDGIASLMSVYATIEAF